ncbi:hypothetical protein FQN54_007185 [Arachnomyces sp. PD_36]|nr:hypothetical protein FQN54_007185 [Arachnomyces sp. PD_36]
MVSVSSDLGAVAGWIAGLPRHLPRLPALTGPPEASQVINKEDLEELSPPPVHLDPQDELFLEKILYPCGLRRDFHSVLTTPRSVFGDLPRPTKSRVFLDLDTRQLIDISWHIELFHRQIYDQGSLSFVSANALLQRERYIDHTDPKGIIPLRADKWKFQKVGGPQSFDKGYVYDWNIQPEVTYMISINSLTPHQQRKAMTNPTLLAESHGLCPYLTIEYAKACKHEDAMRRIATASMVWLNQRRSIRKRAGSEVYTDLKHYAFTVSAVDAVVWEMVCTDADADGDGDGYVLRELGVCSLTNYIGLDRFVKWSNAVHAWGLGPYAEGFVEDVERYVA